MCITSDYRLYSITNMYLSDIQRGIQTAHLVGEMTTEYNPQFVEWAQYDKTIIVLNGGYSSNLRDIWDLMNVLPEGYCYAKFNESDDALDSALTCVGIILPKRLYSLDILSFDTFAEYSIQSGLPHLVPEEYELLKIIKSCKLA